MAVCTNVPVLFPPSHSWHQYHPHFARWSDFESGGVTMVDGLPGGIVDWGRYFHNGTKGAAEETGLEVKIRRLVEFTRHQTEIREFIRFVF